MSTRSASRASVFFAVLLAATTAAPSAIGKECRGVDGPFTSTLVPPPTCASPVGLCTHGVLAGNFPGTYDFTFYTMAPVPDHPGRFFYTGQSVITPSSGHGQLFSDDHGYLDMNPAAGSPFVTTVIISRGTGRYETASGVLVAQGVLDLSTGQAVGTYTGGICRPDDDDGEHGEH